jgi:hypothetical protein
VVNSTPRPLYPREGDPAPIVEEAGWAPRTVWTAAENLAPTGIRSPDRPARSESLYRLRYPGPLMFSYSDFYICDVNYPAIVLGVLYKIRKAVCGDHVCLSVCDKYRRLNGLSDVHGIWCRNFLRKVEQG